MSVDWQIAWDQSCIGRLWAAVARWARHSTVFSLLSRALCALSRWAGHSVIAGTARRHLGDRAVRESFLVSTTLTIAARWWQWNEPVRGFLSRVVSGSSLVILIRRLGTPGRGIMRGSILGRLAKLALSQPYPVVALWMFALSWPFLPTTVTALLLIGLASLRLIYGPGAGAGPVEVRRSPLVGPWLLLAVVLCFSLAFSVAGRGSIPALSAWALSFLAAYLALDTFRRPGAVVGLLQAITLSAAAVSMVGLGQAVQRIQTAPGWMDSSYFPQITTRIFSVFDSPIILGQFLALSIPLGLYVVLAIRGRWRLVYAGAVGLQGLALILTWTRGSWMAVLISLLLLMTWWRREMLVLFLCLLIALPVLLPPVVVSRFLTTFDLEYGTNRYRQVIWATTLDMIRDHPLTGIGLGSAAFDAVYPYYMIAGTRSVHTHNLFLQLALEMGLVGLLAVIFFLGGLAVLVWRKLRAGPSPESGILAVLAIAVTGLMMQAMADHIWYSPKFMMFFWFILGVIMAMVGRTTEPETAP